MDALTQIASIEFAGAFFVTFLAATLHSTVGFGFALISVPILALLNPLFAPVPQLLVVFPLALAMLWRERHAVEIASTGWILLGRFPGAAIGIVLLKWFSSASLDVVMGLMVLTAIVIVTGHRGFSRTPAREALAGTASGIMGMVSSIGGPPIALLYRNDAGPVVRANLALVFSIGLCITIGGRVLADEILFAEVMVGAALLPAVLLGLAASQSVIPGVDAQRLKMSIATVAGASSVVLMLRGIAQLVK